MILIGLGLCQARKIKFSIDLGSWKQSMTAEFVWKYAVFLGMILIGLGPWQPRKIKFSSDLGRWKQGSATAEFVWKYVVFLVWALLGHGLCMCSVWFCIDFLDFSTSIFFPFFFLTSCMGPYDVPETSFYRRNSLLAPKKHPIKEALVQEMARFYTIFI